MVQDKAILTTADQYKVVYDLSIGPHFQWPWTIPNPDFKVTPILDVEYAIIGPYLGL